MATKIMLTHTNGLRRTAYFGYSWTSLFFGGLPAIFRGDWLAFGIYFVLSTALGFTTFGIGNLILWIIWPFFYNGWHVRRLIEKGYQITDASPDLEMVKARVMETRSSQRKWSMEQEKMRVRSMERQIER